MENIDTAGDDVPLLEKKPAYAVLFTTDHDPTSYEPLVSHLDVTLGTLPHGLDRDIVEALPALWYCLHLPSTLFDLIDLNVRAIKESQLLDTGHEILLLPIQVFDKQHFPDWPGPASLPALVMAPERILTEAAKRSADFGFTLPPVAFEELSASSIKGHWQAIHKHLAPALSYVGYEPVLSERLDLAPLDLPRRLLLRQMGKEVAAEKGTDRSMSELLKQALWEQAVVSATARLEKEGKTREEAEKIFRSVIAEERSKLRIPLVLSVPGVAPAYQRAFGKADEYDSIAGEDEADIWSTTMSERPDHLLERAAIESAATHRAIARKGLGLMLPSLPGEAFVALAELERHVFLARTGRKVWTMLDRLDAAASSWWRDVTLQAIPFASMLTVFSNFPLGFLRMPGDTAPLSCRLPIAYRPLNPLTRTIQMELHSSPMVDLSSGINVLVAHCIPTSDPAGRLARQGWDSVTEMIEQSGQHTVFHQVETLSVDALRKAVSQHQPNILVLIAHGAYDGGPQGAALMVGDELSIGPGLGPLPPVVILSSCHVAPRGTGTVSVADLLLREGALCVLAAQVPIDVRRNTTLIMRFFLYMAEVLAGREDHSSILEIWHRVQTSNAVNDILSTSTALQEWGMNGGPNGSALSEFMNVRSVGRVSRSHVYRDTEQLLVEIAEERGDGVRVRAILEANRYLPESAFYVFIGRPERVFLRLPIQLSSPDT